MRSHSPRATVGGMALIFTVATLALIATLGISFANLMSLERHAGANYALRTRARIAAESGLEYAISRLRDVCGTVPTVEILDSMRYENDPERPAAAPLRCSFALPEDPTRSGYVGEHAGSLGTFYRLRVSGEDGKLNINDSNGVWNIDTDFERDGDPVQDAEDIANSRPRLTALVEGLCEILWNDPDLAARVAEALFTARARFPDDRFPGLRDVRAALTPGTLSQTEYERFESFITLHSWQDPDVIRPSFQCAPARPFHDDNEPEALKSDVYLWSDWQTKCFALEPRCPVNINTAPVELIEALIRPLQGWYLREGPGSCASFSARGGAWWSLRTPSNSMTSMPLPYPGYRMSGYFDYPRFEYRWTDGKTEAEAGAFRDSGDDTGQTGDKAVSRLGQAMLTPSLDRLTTVDGTPLPMGLARALHRRIHEDRNPVETWQECELVLDSLLDALLPDSSPSLDVLWNDWMPKPCPYDMGARWSSMWAIGDDFVPRTYGTWNPGAAFMMRHHEIDTAYWRPHCRRIVRDMLLANFNPNSQIQDNNPDAHLWRRVDKAKLTRHTTEWIFQWSGTFRIDSAGVVSDADGKAIAEFEQRAIVELCRPARMTTQAQLTRGMTDPAGMGPLPESWTGRSPAWKSTIASYPEPILRDSLTGDPDSRYLSNSIVDGYLMPSTLEHPSEGFMGAALTFAAHFDGRLTPSELAPADENEAHPELYLENPVSALWQGRPIHESWCVIFNWGQWSGIDAPRRMEPALVPRNIPSTKRLTYPSDAKPLLSGALLPDGALSDVCRGLGYRATNFGCNEGKNGAVQFWCKPNFDPQCTTRIRCLFNLGENKINSYFGDTPGTGEWTGGTGQWPQMMGLFFLPHYGYHQYEIPRHNELDAELSQQPDDAAFYENLTEPECWTGIAPCSLFFGAAGVHQLQGNYIPANQYGYRFSTSVGPVFEDPSFAETYICSPTVVRRFPNQHPGFSQRNAHASYFFEARQWSHVICSWNMPCESFSPPVAYSIDVTVNGKNPRLADGPVTRKARTGIRPDNRPWLPCYIHHRQDQPTWARFGGSASEFGNNYVADCTYDEIIGHRTQAVSSNDLNTYSTIGRYYTPAQADQQAVYCSPKWNLEASGVVADGRPLEVLSVAWTGYWPLQHKRFDYKTNQAIASTDHLPVNVNDNDRPDPLVEALQWTEAWDPFSVDIATTGADGNPAWFADRNGDAGLYDDAKHALTYAGGSKLKNRWIVKDGDVQLRVYFNQTPGKVTLEAPALDDITLFVHRGVILLWLEVA